MKLLVPTLSISSMMLEPIDRIILAAAGHMLAQQLRLSERNGVVVDRAAVLGRSDHSAPTAPEPHFNVRGDFQWSTQFRSHQQP